MIFGWKTKPEWIAVYEKRAAERAARMETLMRLRTMREDLEAHQRAHDDRPEIIYKGDKRFLSDQIKR